MTDLGTAIGSGADATWSGTGRRLTPWEQSMRTTRADLWLPINDAVYRLALREQQYVELERAMGTGTGRLVGDSWAFDDIDSSAQAPAEHFMLALRLALVGGGQGVRDGQAFAVSPVLATQITEALAGGPMAIVVRIVRAFLAAAIHGRPATTEEQAAFSIPAGAPIVPAWALEYRA